MILDLLDLDGIRISAPAIDGAAGENHVIPTAQIQNLLCAVAGIMEHHIHTGERFAQ